MLNSLHDLCLFQLDHPLNQSLVCGKRWPSGPTKELIINYNLIHLFVVSGAHALFFEKGLNKLGFNRAAQISSLSLYVLCCNFSSPISRCFFERLSKLISEKSYIFFPSQILKLISFFLCLPISYAKGECLSLFLSLYFSLIVSSISNLKSFEFKVMLISLPVYLSVLGLPHYSSLLVLMLVTPIIGSILLPLSFLALFSDNIEWLSHMIWWKLIEFIQFLEVFFNYPKKQAANFDNGYWILIHLVLLLCSTHLGMTLWRRKLFFT